MDAIKAPAAPSRRPQRSLIALVAALLLVLIACQPKPSGPAIWRLADADSEIWLFGTVHVLPADLQWRTERINRAFANADTVVFETDTSGDAGARLAALFEAQGFTQSGPPLSERLPPVERLRFFRVARRLGVAPAGLAELERMRPWFAAMQLSFMFVRSMGHEPGAGVDAILAAEAERLGKRRAFLETAEEQVSFLADLPPEVELRFLISSLRQIEEDKDSLAELDQAWVRGDTRELARLLNGLIEEAGPEVYRAVITDRNSRWTAEIEQMLAGKDDVFIAVGAAHLVGRGNVIEQLRARGHRVQGP